ncbi:hypothetical protein Pst134EA_015953 [Puccinia striiformis f. sp. tritici]|uniref:GH18 domain-containing protein n=1 Tax=Puccinia striiformis f. sp. tritici PST-78 TaxID=1165861 RepID=A0A0L0UXM8_9BASI|nr:hypothetical protein Pst134EA_015953 [Puccinia striiformis f. sp. tritici]KAH9463873.1 hypothetical protein Pst134EA_015953 [Puccinia striiformis f. sp. tritici]KNE91785.1 hypothetical protein PSTG_14802 [Puccinia striiformis f. sp. tritici PST-78]
MLVVYTLFAALHLFSGTDALVVRAESKPTLSGYYPGYHSTLLPPESIPWDLYTHLDYFVATTGSEASEDLKIENEENMKAVVAGAKSHGVSISLTVGGWTGSKYFSKLVTDEDSRKTFAQTFKKTLDKYGFDGVDIDWEYPNVPGNDGNILSPNDAANYLQFLKTLREVLGPKARISAAVSVHGFMGPDGSYLIDHKPYAEVLDFITIMAYDLYSPSSTDLAGPNAPLFETCNDPTVKVSVAKAIQTWTSTGFPASKILLGLPAYGYKYTMLTSELTPTKFSGQDNLTSLYFSKIDKSVQVPAPNATAAGPTTCGGEEEGHTWLFKDLVNCGLITPDGSQGLKGYTRYYDHCSRTPFLFESSSKTLISYDDARSLARKTRFVKENGLAGVNVFDATGDTQDRVLLKAIQSSL